MSSAEGESGTSLPTLSWDPVVTPPRSADTSTSTRAADDPAPDGEPPEATSANVAGSTSAAGDGERISFDLQLDLGGATAPAADEPTPPESAPVAPGPAVPLAAAGSTLSAAPEPASAPVSFLDPPVISPDDPPEHLDAAPLPPIREATPVEPLPEVPSPTVSADAAAPVLGPENAVAPAPDIRLPDSHQPDQTALAAAAPAVIAPVDAPPVSRERQRGRGLFALLLVLLLLGAVVAAAVIVGRPLLFPEAEWDADVEPYAVAIEEVRGTGFVEPVTVTVETDATFERRATTELLGDWESELPAWRALALANGAVTADSVGEVVAGGPDAVYSTADGQVYRRDGADADAGDAAMTAALAAAAIDQDVRWSQASRTLDATAFVDAAVEAESGAILEATAYAAPLPERDAARLAFLPPVLAYRALAPMTYVHLLPADVAVEAAAMEQFALVGDTTVASSSSPQLVPGDAETGASSAPDRSFWYLVFGAYLDRGAAHTGSQAIVESSLTEASDGERTCVYATFSGGAVDATGVLRATLDRWAAAAPAQFGATVTALPDGALQLRSCDPGAGFENGARFGVANELIGFRAAELATFAAVVDAGGADDALGPALASVAASAVPGQLAATPVDLPPRDAAAAARAAVGPIVAPAPRPPTEGDG